MPLFKLFRLKMVPLRNKSKYQSRGCLFAILTFLLTIQVIIFINTDGVQHHLAQIQAVLSRAYNTWNVDNNIRVSRIKNIAFVNSTEWLHRPFNFSRCEITECNLKRGDNLSDFTNSAAVIFYGVGLTLGQPPIRPNPDQIWVFAIWESPLHIRSKALLSPEWRNQINWTMTYRSDSDIHTPYGLVTKYNSRRNNYTEIVNRKTNLVAWVVSNCYTINQRAKYAELLMKTVPVDIFGKCGNKTQTGNIFKKIGKYYKFYLAFENSLCNDYITEKFFDRQNLDVVVIARGSGNYTNFYPKDSFIDTRDFKTVKDLGEYLKYLDKNRTAYVEYLKAKEKYISDVHFIQNGHCQLCAMLHSVNQHRNVYHNVHKWFTKDQCHAADDII